MNELPGCNKKRCVFVQLTHMMRIFLTLNRLGKRLVQPGW